MFLLLLLLFLFLLLWSPSCLENWTLLFLWPHCQRFTCRDCLPSIILPCWKNWDVRLSPTVIYWMQNRQEKRFLLFCSSCLRLWQWTREIKRQYALKEICPDFHCIMINLILCMSLNTLELNEKTDPGNVLRHQYYHTNSNLPLYFF